MAHEFVQIQDLLLENSFIPTILLGYILEKHIHFQVQSRPSSINIVYTWYTNS